MLIGSKNSEKIDKLKRRIVKVLTLGRSAVSEAFEVSPHGISASAPKGAKAVFSESMGNGEKLLLGYLNTNQGGVESGGFKIYATDDNGEEQIFIYLRPNGQIEFGGNDDNLVRFSDLETAFNQLKQDFNTHTHAGITSGPSSTPPPTVTSTADIAPAKINEFKIP